MQERSETTLHTISLFSVDQIREEESPWKALVSAEGTSRSIRRASPFKKRLQERKKVRMLYGNLSSRALNRYLKEIHRPEDLLLTLESRLDIVLKRAALFPSVQSARKAILQGGIAVNYTVVSSPRYHCTPGDFIQVIQKSIVHCSCYCFAKQNNNMNKNKNKNNSLVSQVNVNTKLCFVESLALKTETGRTKQNFVYGALQELFAFSELLQLWDRKTGRLHSSALFDLINSKKSISSRYSSLKVQGATLKKTINPFESNVSNKALSYSAKQGLECADLLDNGGEKELSQKQLRKNVRSDVFRQKTHTDQVSMQLKANSDSDQALSSTIASRPLHLEVSYRNLCVVFLYPPQRICVDVSIDLSLLS